MKTHFYYYIIGIAFTLLLMSPSCEDKEAGNTAAGMETIDTTNAESLKMDPIKYTFNGDFKDLWEKVDSLQNLGLYKSANDVVSIIFDSAQEEDNTPQTVKALIHRMKYNAYMTDDDFVMALNDLDKLSKRSTFPLKQIIHSIAAESYWGYYQQNRWQFYNRTQTVNFENEDIRTWDLTKIANHVNMHYMSSLTNKDSLQHTTITDFKEILVSYDESGNQRPTLYDFLAHRALNFFENTESSLVRPEDKFVVKGGSYFGTANEFLSTPTNSTDSVSNALYATKVFKDLTRFHLKDKNPAALIDLELRRLSFSRSMSLEEKKDTLYLIALNKLAKTYSNFDAYTEIRFKCAEFHTEKGGNYNVITGKDRWEIKTAVEICDEAISRYPNSLGANQCRSLRTTIHNKNLSFKTEVAYSPGSVGKMLIDYKNMDTVHFKMVKVPWNYFYNQNLYGTDLMEDLLKKTVVESWTKVLQNPGDFQSHSTEITIPAKDFGQYVVLSSPDKNFKLDMNAIAYGSYWVTNLSYNFRKNDDESIDVFVADRETGEPLRNVKANVYTQKYNYTSRKNELHKEEGYTTDEFGMFTIVSKTNYRYMYVDLASGKDQYNNASQLYQYKPYSKKKSHTTTHFFTDRSIYRPGQTIYFKGIRIHHDGDAHNLEIGKQTTVQLYDVNNQKVSDVLLTTNEYGTFSGSFTAPMGVLTGQMRIQDKYGSKYFSVEEYKRPKFEVDFEPIAGVYKIGQTIKVIGTAKAYAGSNIDGANVQYRITRSCSFPWWAWQRYGYSPSSQSVEIKNGATTTDENGLFTVEFEAKEDASINKKYYPNYSYTVSADVTDVNGETHSSNQWVMVGYNCMNLNLGLSATIERTEKNRFKVSTTNLNGEKIEASGTIKVNRLIEPDQLYRTSLWTKPDIQEFSKEEYKTNFPHDQYSNEQDYTKYKVGELITTISFNTAKNDSIDFNGMKTWKPGRYVVESSSVDAFGETVKDVKYIVILDKTGNTNATNDLWSCIPLKSYCEPGENAEFLISSGAENLKVLYEIEHKGKIVERKFITLSASQQKISIPILEKHRGNVSIHFSAIKFGRSHVSSQQIYVPYSNKVLDVEFETFRNKLLPGSKEEWKIKIKGPKGEKVAAEMLATMYDASLDAFAVNSFYMNIFNSYYSSKYWSSYSFNQANSQLYYNDWNPYYTMETRNYDHLNWWGYNTNGGYYYKNRGSYDWDGFDGGEVMLSADASAPVMEMAESESSNGQTTLGATGRVSGNTRTLNAEEQKESAGFTSIEGTGLAGGVKDGRNELGAVKARSNLNETAFFYPNLETNEKGEVIFKFTIPEALTRWKFLGMAHTKDLDVGYIQKEVVTQKELMIVPNAPRFLREGDKMTFTSKVSNLSEEDLNGSAQLMLFDALTMKPIDSLFKNVNAIIDFNAKKGQSARLAWNIEVPFGIGAVTYRVVAKAKNFTDGEEMAIPVLSNRILVTESMPLPSKGIGTKDFAFTKLLNSGASSTIKHHKLTLEYTSNPAWYAIQAMPYMMEYPYECAEQVFTRYYSNAIASNIVNSSPKIKNVFESWKQSSPDAFLSNLEKNQELKSLMLEETPWVLDAQNEGERKKRVALLFDLNKMDNELGQTILKLQKMQVSNGGWPWFPGMEESRYITQHIITGMGHLDNLGVKNVREQKDVWNMVQNGVRYLDARVVEDYKWLKNHDPYYLTEQRIGEIQVQYLYSRSYFKDLPISKDVKEAFDYYQSQASTYWKNFNLYNEGMIALQAHRYDVPNLPSQIMASIKERAIVHDELGMYWKDNVRGYFWYQAPIETQALLIEAFDEVTDDATTVEELKVWLLKQKQTTDWKTTKATTEACYALLLRGVDLLANDEQVEIKVNNKIIDPVALGAKVEAGTGYFKTSWEPAVIVPEMGNVSVTRKTNGVSWGAMYWQYFEDLDKITMHETPLKLNKKLFIVENTSSGPVMKPITENTSLKPGDKVRVRIELRSDRDMEYVHLKDMRAAGFEPVNVFSRYKWQDGLGYYENTKDAATNFFMDYLPKGTYVFEYDLRVSHFGDFSNGIATIQCMYAPEFTSHSEGIRVNIAEKED